MTSVLDKYKKIFFIGIGGISMSALAMLSKRLNKQVLGSDYVNSDIIENIKKAGINVFVGHNASNITQDIDLVVFSGAVNEHNVERIAAKNLGIEQMERSNYLALLSNEYGQIISIAGTHGKTTTTCMLSEILINAGLNPTVHIGGESLVFGNVRIGGNDIFVTEACEYRNSFATLKSDIGIITNVDADHLDYYKDIADIKRAFTNFANNCKQVVMWQNKDISSKVPGAIVVGFKKSNDFFVCDVKRDKFGRYSYVIKYKTNELCKVKLNVIGSHFVKDSACAFAVAYLKGISKDIICNSLFNYHGVARRNELLGIVGLKPVIADYAHHPTEIKASVKALKHIYKRILCVFQPHTYTRTKALMEEFKCCFDDAAQVAVYKTYPAREELIDGADAYSLFQNIDNSSKCYYDDIDQLFDYVCSCTQYDLVLILGAGDIYNCFKSRIVKSLNKYVD